MQRPVEARACGATAANRGQRSISSLKAGCLEPQRAAPASALEAVCFGRPASAASRQLSVCWLLLLAVLPRRARVCLHRSELHGAVTSRSSQLSGCLLQAVAC